MNEPSQTQSTPFGEKSPSDKPSTDKIPSLERWLAGRVGTGPRHQFGYRVTPDKQGGVLVEVVSRGTGPATTIDRFLGGNNRIEVIDRRIFEEIRRAQLGPRSIYMVQPQNAPRFIKLLAEANLVTDARSQKPLQFRGEITPELTDHREGGKVRLKVEWKTKEGATLQLGAVPFTVFDDHPSLLWIGNSIYTSPLKLLPDTFRRLVTDREVEFEVGALSQSVSRLELVLSELGLSNEWLNERLEIPPPLAIRQVVRLSFEAPALRADAEILVGPHKFPLTTEEDIPEAVWLPASPPKWGTKVIRDRAVERAAQQVLVDAGFKNLGENVWEIRGDDALDLVRRELAPLIGHFEILWQAPPKKNLFRTGALESTVQVTETPRGDWFDVKVSFATGQSSVPIADIIDQVDEGKRFIQLTDGSFAEATPALRQAVRLLKGLLEDKASSGQAQMSVLEIGDMQGLIDVVDHSEVAAGIEKYIAPFKEFDKIDKIEPHPTFKASLRDYQKDGLSWMAFLGERGLGGILADDMGLGKTVQTLALLQYMKHKHGTKPSLIVCPTSVVENWCREAHRFAPDLIVHRVDGPNRDEYIADAANADMLVTSYALLRRDFEKIKDIAMRYAILDEAQAIKNPTSQTAMNAKKLNATTRLALTGTPIENRLSELWSIFDFASPRLFGSLADFKERYLVPIERHSDDGTLQRLRRTVRPFILRREKEVVARELPPKTISQVFCDVPAETQVLYRQIAERAQEHLQSVLKQKGFERSTISILTELLRLRQVACDPRLLKDETIKEAISPKVGPFLELVEEALDSGRKILVFSQFVGMLDILSNELTAKGTEHLMLTGASRKRQALVDRFQADDGPRVFLISLKAGGAGLNLTAADMVIHFDPWWNPAVEEQATDRAHRIGQTKPVFVYEMVARGTVEEKILKLKDRKRALAEGVLGVDGALSKLLTEDEVMALFESSDDDWNDEDWE